LISNPDSFERNPSQKESSEWGQLAHSRRTRSIQAPTSTSVVTHPIESDGSRAGQPTRVKLRARRSAGCNAGTRKRNRSCFPNEKIDAQCCRANSEWYRVDRNCYRRGSATFQQCFEEKGFGKKQLARFSVIGEQHVSFHFSRSPLKSKGLRLMSLEERMRHVLRWYNLWTVQILTAPVLARRRLRSLEDHQVFTNYRSTF